MTKSYHFPEVEESGDYEIISSSLHYKERFLKCVQSYLDAGYLPLGGASIALDDLGIPHMAQAMLRADVIGRHTGISKATIEVRDGK